MKIERENIDKVSKALKALAYNPVTEMSYIFMPIDGTYSKEVSGLELSVKSEQAGSRKAVPGLLLTTNEDGKKIVALAYADTSYTPSLDLIQFIELTGKCGRKEKEILAPLEAYLIKKEYIFMMLYI